MDKNINIEKILELHQLWLKGDEHGERADLRGLDLSFADLSFTNLSHADLMNADLRNADLSNVSFYGANLSGANLDNTNLNNANFKSVNLSGTNLDNTNLDNVEYDECTSFFALSCPEKGSFIGYKRTNGCIIELLITEDSKRSSATTRKCRCSKAKVLDITDIKTNEKRNEVRSIFDDKFIYKVGEIIEVDNFDENRWNEYSTGIHFFITKEEAINYRRY